MCFVSQHKLCLVFSFVYVCVRFIQLTLSGLQTSLLFLFFFPIFFFFLLHPTPSREKTCSVFRVKRIWVAASCWSTKKSSMFHMVRRRERVRESYGKYGFVDVQGETSDEINKLVKIKSHLWSLR